MTTSHANRQRSLIAVVQILGLSVWFSATAVVPSLRSEWGLGSIASGWLTASLQIGFATGASASALLRIADRIAPQCLIATGGADAAACTAALTVLAHGLWQAIPLRFLTGVALALVYPIGMKLMASWSDSADRGRWFGFLLGSLALGSAVPQLISGLGPLPWKSVMATAAVLSAAGAVIADSGAFSTALSEIADKSLVGTALTAQTAAGFLLTVLTIQLVPVAADLLGWQYAFLLLAPGPLIGAAAMIALRNPVHDTPPRRKSHDYQLNSCVTPDRPGR